MAYVEVSNSPINQHRQQRNHGWFKDEELTESTLTLTFHIATETLEGMKAKG